MSRAGTGKIGAVLLLTTTLLLVVGANVWKTSLKVRRVEVQGNRLVGTNEVLQLAQISTGTPLYNADLSVIQRNVSSHHYVKDVVVERDLPGTVRVVVRERVPIAIVTRSETVYLDEDGVVLPRTIAKTLFDLPVISGVPAALSMPLGSRTKQEDVAEALEILSALRLLSRELSHNISEVRLRDGHDLVLFAAEGGIPIIFGRGETAQKLVRLENFWNTIVRTRGPQHLQYVDLRYEDQVVARWADNPAKSAS
jgi:cell division protein FtsQ